MRNCSIPLMVALAALVLAVPAQAGGLVLKAADFDAQPGSTGSFLVTLTNTGTTAATLSGYEIQMTTDVVGLSFTSVSQPMPPDPAYVFAGGSGPTSSDFGPPLPTTPVTTFTAVDSSVASSGFDTLAAGQTYGVLRVDYAVAPTAPLGMGQVSFVSPGSSASDLTQLADGSGGLIGFTATNAIVSVVVPEPSGAVLLVLGLILLAAGRRLVGRGGWSSARTTKSLYRNSTPFVSGISNAVTSISRR
jgi:hypothetical protein